MSETTTPEEIQALTRSLATSARAASQRLATTTSGQRNAALEAMASALLENRTAIQAENRKDLDAGRERGLAPAMLDRLALSDKVLEQMAAGLREVAALPDPVGEVVRMWNRPNGLRVGQMRIPLGVVAIIYESRPNVTADTAGLCVKSGNAVILRGGSEAAASNRAVADTLRAAVESVGLPADAIMPVPVTDRAAIAALIKLDDLVDVVVPRGGEGLIRFVAENSRVPVIKHYKGVCSVYVDSAADLDKAVEIAVNAKAQRPGVCNAMENLYVHQDVAAAFYERAKGPFEAAGIELRGCERTRELFPAAAEATDADFDEEFLDLRLAGRVVADMDEAIDLIRRFGSQHTDSIITQDVTRANAFVAAVDSSAVMVNASTRFNDGFQLGLGAEMGISTSKLHCFGPMGLVDLTTTKYIVYGEGHIRES